MSAVKLSGGSREGFVWEKWLHRFHLSIEVWSSSSFWAFFVRNMGQGRPWGEGWWWMEGHGTIPTICSLSDNKCKGMVWCARVWYGIVGYTVVQGGNHGLLAPWQPPWRRFFPPTARAAAQLHVCHQYCIQREPLWKGGAQCLRIGEHGDNFVFDHNLHFFRILKGSVRLGQALYQGIVDTVSSLLSSIVWIL